MPQFHETGYGSRFYNGQLPALIHALERIAVSLEKLSSKPVFEEKTLKEMNDEKTEARSS